jgi:FkbM family methyltransferase
MGIDLFKTVAHMGLPAPKGILQVGASYGQELKEFLDNGIRFGLLIEPLQEPFQYISNICKQLPGFVAVQALCTDESGKEYNFHVSSNGGQSSSILKPKNHLQVYDFVKFNETQTIRSNTLDEVLGFIKQNGLASMASQLDTLYMDTQGAELYVLMGANATLKQINYIYTEISRGELYEGQPSFAMLSNWLEVAGFTFNNAYFDPGHTGNALFIRRSLLGLG